MEKELARMHLKEIARAKAYARNGRHKMAVTVLTSSLCALERKMKMDGACTEMTADLYVCVFTAYLQMLFEAETDGETNGHMDAAFADALFFLETLPDNQYVLLVRCYVSAMQFLCYARFEHLRKFNEENIGKTSRLIDEAAKQDALDETVLWGAFYARAALFSSRHALCSSDEVNALYDKAMLYLDTYGCTGSPALKAHGCSVRSKICTGKMLHYLRKEQYGRACQMYFGALKAQMLEMAFRTGDLAAKLIACLM